MLLIGLTGGIASGKTLVASFFKKKRISVIDADLIAREVVQKGKKGYQEIVSVFGPGILTPNGSIDREQLGRLVFADENRRRLLESITHPEIRKEIRQRIATLKKKKVRAVVVDAALLFESGLYQEMDKSILVIIDPKIQIKRLIQRDRLTELEAMARILAQLPSTKKERLTDFLIDNSGAPAATERQFTQLWQKIQGIDRNR